MWITTFCLISIGLQCTFAGVYPNFRAEWEFKAVEPKKDWWETASFYQIYPRSFKDSDGDGIGDLKGITEMLPYLKEIGITATWLSPIFKSPMADFGYDISDFYDIQPEYGTMADFNALVLKAKSLGIKLILDFVPNHSSDECEWFKKSVRKERGFEDFYVWHKGLPDPNNATNRLPPSNWISVFRKSAWTWNPIRKEYYFHQFVAKQPDLNYRNPKVVEQMKDVLTFWLNKGVDGFRIDAVPHLFEIAPDNKGNYKDEPLSGNTNDPEDYGYLNHIYTVDQPETIDMVYQWRATLDAFKKQHKTESKIIMAETYSPIEIVMKYYGNGTTEGAQIPFNFLFISQLSNTSTAMDFKNTINNWWLNMPTGRTANWVMGNHDKSRVGTRFGIQKIDLMNIILLTLPGASVNYNGEEIGMTDVFISWKDTVDPSACNSNPDIYQYFTRDPERTPFQWNDDVSAGFSTNKKTWLPVALNYKEVNVKLQRMAAISHLNIYKQLQNLRTTDIIKYGNLDVKVFGENILATIRIYNKDLLITLANVGSKLEEFDMTTFFGNIPILDMGIPEYVLVSGNSPHRIGDVILDKIVTLIPNEAVVLKTYIKISDRKYFEYSLN